METTTQGLDARTAPREVRGSLLITGLAGLLFVVSVFFEAPEVDDGATGAELRRHYEDNLGGYELAVFGGMLGFVALILLVVGLRALLRSRQASSRLLDLVAVSGTLTAAWMWMNAAILLIPVVAADDDGKLSDYSDDTLLSLDFVLRLGETFGDGSTAPRGLLVLGVSAAALASGLFPRWTGYLGTFVGLASLVGIAGLAWGGPLVVAWFVGLFGFLLWTLVIALVCLVRAVRHR
jgi:hypothetical protein